MTEDDTAAGTGSRCRRMNRSNRRQRRAVSRDEARRTARPNPTPGKNRAQRRALRYRPSVEIPYHRSQASAPPAGAPWTRPCGRSGQGRSRGRYPSGQKPINHKPSVREREFLDRATHRLTPLDREGTREAA